MAKIDYKKTQAELFKRTEGYAANVRAVYRDVMMQIINLVKNTDLESGKPFSFADYGYSEQVRPCCAICKAVSIRPYARE